MQFLRQAINQSWCWQLGAYSLRVQPLAMLLTLAAFCTLIKLGVWQLQRAEQKQLLQTRAEQLSKQPPVATSALFSGQALAQAQYRQSGQLLFQYAQLLDNRIHGGMAGYHLVVPFQPDDSAHLLLVNLGWLPMGQDRRQLPEFSTIEHQVMVAGRLKSLDQQLMLLSEQSLPLQPQFPLRIQRIEIDKMQQWSGRKVAPWLLLLDENLEWGYPRSWPVINMSPAKHKGYALQWFGIALALLVLAIRWMVKRDEK